MIKTTICPVCGGVSEAPYTRKRKCQECGTDIYHRKEHKFIFGRHVMTGHEAAIVDYYDTLCGLLYIEEADYNEARDILRPRYKPVEPHPEVIVFYLSNSSALVIRSATFDLQDWQSAEMKKEYVQMKLDIINAGLVDARKRFLGQKEKFTS